jgi:hypothetical protein
MMKKTDAWYLSIDRQYLHSKRIDSLATLVENHTTSFIDFETLRTNINESIDYLALMHRFWKIAETYDVEYELTIDNGQSFTMVKQPKFKLGEHEFDNLDEVETALKNKAFL